MQSGSHPSFGLKALWNACRMERPSAVTALAPSPTAKMPHATNSQPAPLPPARSTPRHQMTRTPGPMLQRAPCSPTNTRVARGPPATGGAALCLRFLSAVCTRNASSAPGRLTAHTRRLTASSQCTEAQQAGPASATVHDPAGSPAANLGSLSRVTRQEERVRTMDFCSSPASSGVHGAALCTAMSVLGYSRVSTLGDA